MAASGVGCFFHSGEDRVSRDAVATQQPVLKPRPGGPREAFPAPPRPGKTQPQRARGPAGRTLAPILLCPHWSWSPTGATQLERAGEGLAWDSPCVGDLLHRTSEPTAEGLLSLPCPRIFPTAHSLSPWFQGWSRGCDKPGRGSPRVDQPDSRAPGPRETRGEAWVWGPRVDRPGHLPPLAPRMGTAR